MEGPDHVPVLCGLPVKPEKRLRAASLEHRKRRELPPALGNGFSATITVAVALGQPPEPIIVKCIPQEC